MATLASAVPTTRLPIGSTDLAADPWPALRAVRELGPVVWHEEFGRWLVTSDRAVRRLLSDFARYTVEGTVVTDLFGADAFIAMDDRRRHDDLRNVWVDAFRPSGIDRLRPAIDRIVAPLVAGVAARLEDGATVDAADALCRPIPTLVICAMMGVPADAVPDVVRWSDAMASGSASYVDEAEAARRVRARDEAKAGLAAFMLDLLAGRRARPGDDLVSRLAVSEAGRGLPDGHLVQNLRQLLFAGNETTAKWLGHIVVALARRPGLRAALAADRTLIAAANDEVMRFETVVGTTVRRVRGGAIELAGVAMEDGADITCLLGAANRDPARYADPDRFDIHRPAQPNLGFGVGFHNCLGSVLAKAEAGTMVGAMLDRMPAFALAAAPTYSSISLRGPLALPLTRA